ncbi:MAG: hypothetical protein ABEJ31_01755 [Haloarculaceae archaeon]
MAEQVAGPDTPALSSRLAEAANILVLAPAFPDGASGVCFDLLADDDPDETAVLSISYRKSPGEWIDDWTETVGTPPATGLVLAVGDRSHPGEDADLQRTGEPWRIETVEKAADLTGIGIVLSDFLATAGERDGPTRLCFDSLTALLQFADLKRTFRFLHVVTGRVKTADAVGHYHIDPRAHDEQTLATITGLFDAVVEVDDDGEWTVRTR